VCVFECGGRGGGVGVAALVYCGVGELGRFAGCADEEALRDGEG